MIKKSVCSALWRKLHQITIIVQNFWDKIFADWPFTKFCGNNFRLKIVFNHPF